MTQSDQDGAVSSHRDSAGRFAKGNRFWEARSSRGRKPIFSSPDDLWAACLEYFHWVEDNPLYEDKLVTFQGSATHEPVPKMRAMTIAGLCLFLDIGKDAWALYRGRSAFVEVCARAEEVIRTQKFTGAAADLLNPSIIARDLGLAEKSELTGKGGGPIQIEDATKDDADAFTRELSSLAERARTGESSGGGDA